MQIFLQAVKTMNSFETKMVEIVIFVGQPECRDPLSILLFTYATTRKFRIQVRGVIDTTDKNFIK